MRKILVFILVVLIGAGVSMLTGCGDKNEAASKEQLKVVTTIFPAYDFARQVLGEKGNVKLLLPPGSEAHSYEPKPQDIKAIQEADMFIYNGGENEKWVKRVLASINKNKAEKKPKVIAMTKKVHLLEEEIVEGMEHDNHSHHHYDDDKYDRDDRNDRDDRDDRYDDDRHDRDDRDDRQDDDSNITFSNHHYRKSHSHSHEPDEHVWTSPINAIHISGAIMKEAKMLKPKAAKIFENNFAEYRAKLLQIDKQFRDTVRKSKRHTLIFADRFPVRYFVAEYGLDYYAAFPGCSTDTEASAATVSHLIKKVKNQKIPVVFHIELSNKKMANTISEATGAKIMEFNSAHNVTKQQLESGLTYLQIMEKNLAAVKEALN